MQKWVKHCMISNGGQFRHSSPSLDLVSVPMKPGPNFCRKVMSAKAHLNWKVTPWECFDPFPA